MVGADPRTYTPMGLKKVGGKINKRLLDGVLKVATKTGTTLGKPFEKTIQINPFTFGYDIGQDIIGPEIVHAMGRETEEEYNARKAKESKQAKGGRRNKGFLKSVGKVMGAVGKELAPVAKEVFRDVIIPEGKKALREYIKNMGKSSVEGEGEGEVVYATPYYGKGKPRGRPKKSGGVLIRDIPSQFHSSVYPPALASYTAGRDAYGRGKSIGKSIGNVAKKAVKGFDDAQEYSANQIEKGLGTKGSKNVGDFRGRGRSIGKSIGNVAKQAVRGFDDAQEYSANQIEKGLGKKGSKKVGDFRGGARSVRGAIVKEVMAKHGLSLPEASKFVKENNLY